jgi:hypothetical protein
MQSLQDLLNLRNGICVADSILVDHSIVLYRMQTSILLLDKEVRCRPWGVGLFNIAQLQILFDELLHCF